jgi:DNA-binding response OmpR family regulator
MLQLGSLRGLLRRPARVILAEDDADLLAVVALALRDDGLDVVEVPDGGRLLVLLAQCCKEDALLPELIISDVRMPVMTGLAMLKAVREAGWRLPVVLMTAFPDDDTMWRAQSLDATVLVKPFDLAELREVVARCLAPSAAGSRAGGA